MVVAAVPATQGSSPGKAMNAHVLILSDANPRAHEYAYSFDASESVPLRVSSSAAERFAG